MLAPLALSWIERFDRSVLHWVNCDLHAPWLQDVLFFIQRRQVGIPLVVLLALGIGFFRGRRLALRVLVTCALTFVVGWQLAEFMWDTIQRDRPPRVLETVLRTPAEQATCGAHPESVSPRKYVSSRPGFPSQHATHSMGFAVVLLLAVRWIGAVAVFYALLVSIARLMVGTHWPTDVMAGMTIGALIAWGVWSLVPRLFGLVGLRAFLMETDVQGVSKGTTGGDAT